MENILNKPVWFGQKGRALFMVKKWIVLTDKTESDVVILWQWYCKTNCHIIKLQ